MAANDFVTSARQKLREGDIGVNRPNSEAVNNKQAGSVNFLIDRTFLNMKFNLSGFFNANAYDNGAAGIEYINSDCEVSSYFMAIRGTGSSGTNSFNIAVYDDLGAFVGNLFNAGGGALSVSGNNGTNVVIGKKGVDETPSNISVNTGGHSVTHGVLNITTLLAGYVLVPFVVSSGVGAIHLNFNLKCREF
jgi:hypothetical protein